MSPPSDSAMPPTTRRVRKSIGTTSNPRKMMDKENARADMRSSIAASHRSRSKSLGPGGLDTLKSGDGNRRASLADPPKTPRSILKPTIAPISEIPPLNNNAKRTSGRGGSRGVTSGSSSGEDSKVATEEEQQAAAKEKEERDRRDARRKSLANRRVSFAAEATLHTFHEIECAPDSTTSTDSSRRASSLPQTPCGPEASTTDPHGNPSLQIGSNSQSPSGQRKQSKSLEPGPSSSGSTEDDTLASALYSSDSEFADTVQEVVQEEVDDFSSESDDGTYVTVDNVEVTGTSIGSNRSVYTAGDSSLDEALRVATRRAGSQNLGSGSGEEAFDDGEEVIPSFGWIKKNNQAQKQWQNSSALEEDEEQSPPASANEDTAMDMEMDMTNVFGGILQSQSLHDTQSVEDVSSMDMSMDVTKAFGGILPQTAAPRDATSSGRPSEVVDDATMDLTAAWGAIRPGEDTEEFDENENMSMELTNVMGRALGETEGTGSAATTPQQKESRQKASPFRQVASPFLQAAKPGSLFRQVASPFRQAAKPGSPFRQVASPFRQAAKPGSPFRQVASPFRQAARPSPFRQVAKPGSQTPTVVLSPSKRDLSGIGADRSGLGSPQVAARFKRRSSIRESATHFVPGKRAVAFEDPKEMEIEIDRELQEGMDEDNQHSMLQRESPKKNPLRGRKSLHVGSAKGLLGKRPAELDDDEEADDGVKRLKGYNGSPVKNVLLPQPSLRADTGGRITRSARRSLEEQERPSLSPSKSPSKSRALALRRQSQFKNYHSSQTGHDVKFDDLHIKNDAELEAEAKTDRVHLQDFLNLTSIRFMELTTTRRRHTIAPAQANKDESGDRQDELSLERCVVAAACTVPMLELYQHSCRELKKYISEGRRMVKEIEKDTFEENPPLFREYLSATPSVRALMDSQFKNVKTHSRLLSKAMWYEWRMKLQEGLKEGLLNISQGMKCDEELLQAQEQILSSTVPSLATRLEALGRERNSLREAARELAESDPVELESAREQLTGLDADIAQKKEVLAQLRRELDESTAEVDDLTARKEQVVGEINEAEAIRQECRGWSSKEVNVLKSRVDAIETKYGWAVRGITGTQLSMTYRGDMELVFDADSFKTHPNKINSSSIKLRYTGDDGRDGTREYKMEKECFLHMIGDYIRVMDDEEARLANLLAVVSAGWDKSRWVLLQIKRVKQRFPTTVAKMSESSITATVSLLLAPLRTRIEVTLRLCGSSRPAGLGVAIGIDARVIYGEQFNAAKMAEFLTLRIGTQVGGAQNEDWAEALAKLHGKLVSRGQKQQ